MDLREDASIGKNHQSQAPVVNMYIVSLRKNLLPRNYRLPELSFSSGLLLESTSPTSFFSP